MEHEKLPSLFRDLLSLRFDLNEKESPHENLTDIPEIAAVAVGLKAAHVNGQGFRSEKLLAALEMLALPHEFLSLRTHVIVPHFHRPPSYDPTPWEWQQATFKREAQEGPDVLWVYKEAELANRIGETASGDTDVSEVLGVNLQKDSPLRAISQLNVEARDSSSYWFLPSSGLLCSGVPRELPKDHREQDSVGYTL